MEKSRPYVILSAAMSIDGKIATRSGYSKLSSKRDLVRVHTLRGRVDAILVGKKTVSMDDPLLTVRYAKGKNPIRVIIDSKANIALDSQIVKTAKKIPTIIAVLQEAPKKRISGLEKKGVNVIVSGHNKINLKKLLAILQKKGINKMLLEGGGITNWHFLKEGLVDEIILTITPFILGGKEAVSLVEGSGFHIISRSPYFKLKKIVKMENEVVLQYISA